MTGDIWRKHEKQEKLSQKSVMSVCACVVISFPTGCIIFTTNYSICNEAEITEISSHAPWHTPGTHGSYIKIGWLDYFNQDSVLAGEIDVSAKENFVKQERVEGTGRRHGENCGFKMRFIGDR